MARPKRQVVKIDGAKLLAGLRRLTKEHLVQLAVRAVTAAGAAKLPALLDGFLDVRALAAKEPSAKQLLAQVRAFHAATIAGDFYDSFDVDSQSFSERSDGTEVWIEDCLGHLEACTAAAERGSPALAREAFELLFDLLRRLDRGEEVVFFADEGGAWQVGVDWRAVLPGYVRCLAAGCDPASYATAVDGVIGDFADYDRPALLTAARAASTSEQRRALRLVANRRGQR